MTPPGRAIDEPEYVHVAYRYLNEIIEGYGRERGVAGYNVVAVGEKKAAATKTGAFMELSR